MHISQLLSHTKQNWTAIVLQDAFGLYLEVRLSVLNAKIYASKFACLIIFRKMNLILNNPQLPNFNA